MALKVTPAKTTMGSRQVAPKASPNPSKATTPANIKTTFGTPRKQAKR